MAYDVYCYMKKDGKSDVEKFKQTSESTKKSVNTVRRIIEEAKESDLLTVFRTPGKQRSGKRKVTEIYSFDQSVIKRCVHDSHKANEAFPR
ncbi:jg6898 [Pararge aegeria aegeria]|uniref:Jg6898 protein n=1 Tax=Pararge aegeria aegeria TaxID=348720 RepID=A0A8S4QUP6_9NEOP|nr:jg6898 [Pararge aegeria aegeria]